MEVPRSFASSAKHYVAGLIAASWNGGIGAVAGVLGVDSVAMSGVASDVRVLNFHEMLSVFLGAVVLHAVFWLKAHPLPETFDTEAPFFPAPQKPGAQPPALPNQ